MFTRHLDFKLRLTISAGLRTGQGGESTHLICNPAGGHQLIKNVTRQTTRIGGYVGEWEVTMGIFSSGASAIPASITGDEAGHLGRVLYQQRIQPQICDSVAERSTPREEAATEATTIGELWSGTDTAVSGGLGSGGLSLVGSLEGGAAIVAALDSKTISFGCGNGREAVADQRGDDGSALEVEKGIVNQEALRRDQARHFAEALYSHQDRLVEREGSGLCRGGLGVALG